MYSDEVVAEAKAPGTRRSGSSEGRVSSKRGLRLLTVLFCSTCIFHRARAGRQLLTCGFSLARRQ